MRLHSIRARILGGFAALIVVQAAISIAVWHAEERVEAAALADSAAASRYESIAFAGAALKTVQWRLSNYVRSGAAPDLELVESAFTALQTALNEGGVAQAGDDGLNVAGLRSALQDVIASSTARRDKAAKLREAGAEVENAAAALAQAMARAPERATVDAAVELLGRSIQPLVLNDRFSFTADEADRQAVITAAGRVEEAARTMLQAADGVPARLQRLLGNVTGAFNDLKPALDRVTDATAARGKMLNQLDAASERMGIAMLGLQSGLAGERAAQQDEVVAARRMVRTTVVVGAVASGVIGLIFATLVGLSISNPIGRLARAMRGLADGRLDTEIPDRARRDEIGGMAEAVQVFKTNMARADELAAEQQRLKTESAAAQRAALHQTAEGFEMSVGGLVALLSARAGTLQTTAQSMSSTAARTSGEVAAMEGAAHDASRGVQTVAAAAEQLSASIEEIGRQVRRSSDITGRAVANTRRTDGIVQALATAAQKIGDIVQIISGIASQTNLLALNATIEAARAGDAGKGFAVVASEVKILASQTGAATQQIGEQIGHIQGATTEVVTAIRDVGVTIEEVSAIATTIAAAVQEQGAATAEIARNMQRTAGSTKDVTDTAASVSRAAQETGSAATDVLDAARDLSHQADRLDAEVKTFVAGVRAA